MAVGVLRSIGRFLVTSGLAGLCGTGLVFGFNSTERWRMERAIRQGKLSVEPTKREEEELSLSLCQFSIPEIIEAVNDAPNGFCGIVGVKDTGKTSTLKLVANQMPNVVYFTLKKDDVCVELYERLKKSVTHLPWFLDRMRLDSSLSSEDIVMKVFRNVKKTSGTPVTTIFDINLTSEFHLPSPSSPGVFERGIRYPESLAPSLEFNAGSFTRQVKLLVEAGATQCLFAASEGLKFQAEAARESRLHLFMASELSTPISEKFLQQKFDLALNKEEKEMLYRFPRKFTNLRDFAKAKDRKAFADSKFEEEKEKIENTDPRTNQKVAQLYHLALKQPIGGRNLNDLGFSKEEVRRMFVDPNIFTVTPQQKYQFQFDATAGAAKQVCEL